LRVPADRAPTTPYWLAAAPGAGLFRVDDPALVGAPGADPPLHVGFGLPVGRRTFTVTPPIALQWTDPGGGGRDRPPETPPPVAVRADTSVLMFPDARPRALSVHLSAGAAAVAGTVRPELPAGWSCEPAAAPFSLAAKGDEATVAFKIARPGG